MSTEIKNFTNEEFGTVRSTVINGEPYFVGKDVADILGYQNGSRDINRHVEEEDRCKIMVFDGNQDKETIVINESGLYSLILSSKMPKAKQFKHWVTSDVLPSIRKHGMYAADELLADPDLFIQVLQDLKTERQKTEKLSLEVAQNKQMLAEMQPKATYYDLVLQSNSLVPISQIAKDYGISGKAMNSLLNELGVQYRQSGTWLLYQKYADKGYTQSKTFVVDDEKTVMNTYWTQQGRLFLYDLLKNQKGLLPVMEREIA